jgi:hypothetical protein
LLILLMRQVESGISTVLDESNFANLLPSLNVRRRQLPGSVACLVVYPSRDTELLVLVDEDKPLAHQHLARLLAETTPVSASVMGLLSNLT